MTEPTITQADIAMRQSILLAYNTDHPASIASAILRGLAAHREAAVAELRAEVERKDAAIEAALTFLQSAPLESGVCCCGDAVDAHNIGSGHSPVDELTYYASSITEQLQATLSQKETSHGS